MKIVLLTGPFCRGQCGVGDYTVCLANALRSIGVESELMAEGHWGLWEVESVRRSLDKLKPDIIHLQYPTAGFGHSLGPQLFAMKRSSVTTLHEVSKAHFLRKVALFAFSVRPQHLIFTSDFEQRFATRWAPWVSRVSSVIPIGSNIRAFAQNRPRTLNEIVYFGLIMPRKGIEEVLKLGALIKVAGIPLVVRIIGTPPAKYRAYLAMLQSRSRELPVLWDLDLSEEQVGMRLASSSIAYLPYPDGASERRTTLKAALQNGIAVVTSRGPHTPRDLMGAASFCRTPEESLQRIRSLIENSEERARMVSRAKEYTKKFSWERIAKLHLATYGRILSGRSQRDRVEEDGVRSEDRLQSVPGG